jgi:hypothetical protein
MAMWPRIWFNDICLKTGGKKILQGEWLFRGAGKVHAVFCKRFFKGYSSAGKY